MKSKIFNKIGKILLHTIIRKILYLIAIGNILSTAFGVLYVLEKQPEVAWINHFTVVSSLVSTSFIIIIVINLEKFINTLGWIKKDGSS